MEQNLKELLLIDLCARLLYGVKVRRLIYTTPIDAIESVEVFNPYWLNELYSEKTEFKPYLRPISSMTEEERKEYLHITLCDVIDCEAWNEVDWLNKHHFDYRGLIEKGLAIEAPRGIYK